MRRAETAAAPVLCADANVSVQRLAGTADTTYSAGCGRAFRDGGSDMADSPRFPVGATRRNGSRPRFMCRCKRICAASRQDDRHNIQCGLRQGLSGWRILDKGDKPQHAGKHHAEWIVPARGNPPGFPMERLAGTADTTYSAGCGGAFRDGNPRHRGIPQHAGKYHAERIVPGQGNAPVSRRHGAPPAVRLRRIFPRLHPCVVWAMRISAPIKAQGQLFPPSGKYGG